MLHFFKSEFEEQRKLLSSIPLDGGSLDVEDIEENLLLRLCLVYTDFVYQDEHETAQEYSLRIGASDNVSKSIFVSRIIEVSEVLELMKYAEKSFLFSCHGLENSPLWSLIRRSIPEDYDKGKGANIGDDFEGFVKNYELGW